MFSDEAMRLAWEEIDIIDGTITPYEIKVQDGWRYERIVCDYSNLAPARYLSEDADPTSESFIDRKIVRLDPPEPHYIKETHWQRNEWWKTEVAAANSSMSPTTAAAITFLLAFIVLYLIYFFI